MGVLYDEDAANRAGSPAMSVGRRLLWALAALLAAVYLLLAIPQIVYMVPGAEWGNWEGEPHSWHFVGGILPWGASFLASSGSGLAGLELMAWLSVADSSRGTVPPTWRMGALLRPLWRPVLAGLLLAHGLLIVIGQFIFIGRPATVLFFVGAWVLPINIAFGLLAAGSAAALLFSWPLGRSATRVGQATIIASALTLGVAIWGVRASMFPDLRSMTFAVAGIWLGIAAASLRPDRAATPRPAAGRLAYLLLAGLVFSLSMEREVFVLLLGPLSSTTLSAAAIFLTLAIWALLHAARALVALGYGAPGAPVGYGTGRWPAMRGEKIILAILLVLFVAPIVVFGGCELIFWIMLGGYSI